MKNGTRKTYGRHLFIAVYRYFIFFISMCFVITCCMILFLNTVERVAGLELSEEYVGAAAKVTFLNIVLLSAVFTIADVVRRHVMIDIPVKRITDAAEKVMKGDLSVRIEKIRRPDSEGGFNIIIEYFNKMTEELSGIETLRTDFVSNVSHELKTPLAVMQNYGTLLQEPGLSEEKRIEYAKAVTDASRRLADMVSNILKLNKLENQNIYPDVKRYDLGEQLCECLLGFESVWEDKGIDIETDIADGVSITADPELLSLVWNNLFSNALKFTEPGGRVSVMLSADDTFAVVTVADTGCGISREVGSHIFEKFYQGDTSHAAKGNGLGLALVKRVVDIVGGEISVESEVGKGSEFTVRLGRDCGISQDDDGGIRRRCMRYSAGNGGIYDRAFRGKAQEAECFGRQPRGDVPR